jgi:predicted lysophospholipase L1 biosynthesis ABC-type transport system permease subunit
MIHLDDLQYRHGDGVEHVIDTFERPDEWLPILTSGERPDYVGAAEATGQRETALEFSWGRETLDGVRGLYVSPQLSAVPMYASSRLLEVLGLSVGRERALHIAGRVIPFRIVGTLDQFPTIPETNAGFAIAHGPSLMAHVNAVAATAAKEKKPIWPNQVFLTLSGDEAEQETTLSGIVEDPALTGNVVDAATVLEERRRSPLASASWRGLVVMAVVAALIALATGISAHAIASAQDRSGDMALMRALGLSRASAMVAFVTEHVVIAGLAVASGVAVGLWLATVLVPLFQGLGAAPVVPSLVVTTEWTTVGTMVGAVLVGGLVGAAVLWRVYISVPMAGILRIGNE